MVSFGVLWFSLVWDVWGCVVSKGVPMVSFDFLWFWLVCKGETMEKKMKAKDTPTKESPRRLWAQRMLRLSLDFEFLGHLCCLLDDLGLVWRGCLMLLGSVFCSQSRITYDYTILSHEQALFIAVYCIPKGSQEFQGWIWMMLRNHMTSLLQEQKVWMFRRRRMKGDERWILGDGYHGYHRDLDVQRSKLSLSLSPCV